MFFCHKSVSRRIRRQSFPTMSFSDEIFKFVNKSFLKINISDKS